MKAYPSNFKKPIELMAAHIDDRFLCDNGAIVMCTGIDEENFTGDVVFLPPGPKPRADLRSAQWNLDGTKKYIHNWIPGMSIVRKL